MSPGRDGGRAIETAGRDGLVLVNNPAHPLARRESVKPEELKQVPLLVREPGSGSLEVIAHALPELFMKFALRHTRSLR